jgi:membrane protease YdiL (CAAX protease family)
MPIEYIFFAAFLIYFVILQSIWAVSKYKQVKAELNQGTRSKIKFYRETIFASWVAVFLVFGMIMLTPLTSKDLGFDRIVLHSPKWLSFTVTAIMSIYSAYLIYQTIALRICAVNQRKVKLKLSDDVAAILPDSKNEKILYFFVALSAGFSEEILFRGYLMYALGEFFPGLHLWVILLITAGIFGIAHLYQGKRNIITTGFIGLVYGMIYLAVGSIVPVMVLHFLQDVSAVDFKTVRKIGNMAA